MGLARPERETERLARSKQVRLAYELIERAGAEPVGKRGLRIPLLEQGTYLRVIQK
jgi:hypothetical protein